MYNFKTISIKKIYITESVTVLLITQFIYQSFNQTVLTLPFKIIIIKTKNKSQILANQKRLKYTAGCST